MCILEPFYSDVKLIPFATPIFVHEAARPDFASLTTSADSRRRRQLAKFFNAIRPLQPFPANASVLESGRMIEGHLWPTRAKSGCEHSQQMMPPYSITSSAVASSVRGTFKPSA
jgi:hypothetical protein